MRPLVSATGTRKLARFTCAVGDVCDPLQAASVRQASAAIVARLNIAKLLDLKVLEGLTIFRVQISTQLWGAAGVSYVGVGGSRPTLRAG